MAVIQKPVFVQERLFCTSSLSSNTNQQQDFVIIMIRFRGSSSWWWIFCQPCTPHNIFSCSHHVWNQSCWIVLIAGASESMLAFFLMSLWISSWKANKRAGAKLKRNDRWPEQWEHKLYHRCLYPGQKFGNSLNWCQKLSLTHATVYPCRRCSRAQRVQNKPAKRKIQSFEHEGHSQAEFAFFMAFC